MSTMSSRLTVRQVKSFTSVAHRHLALLVLEQMDIRRLRKYIICIVEQWMVSDWAPLPVDIQELYDLIIIQYIKVMLTDEIPVRIRV
jgi:hypothetical protein